MAESNLPATDATPPDIVVEPLPKPAVASPETTHALAGHLN